MITAQQIADAFVKSRMLHPQAVFDHADVLHQDTGISRELAEQLCSLYHEMIKLSASQATREEAVTYKHMLAGAVVSKTDSNGKTVSGRCWPENGIYPVKDETGVVLFYIEPHFGQDYPGRNHPLADNNGVVHRQAFATVSNDHYAVTVTIPAHLEKM